MYLIQGSYEKAIKYCKVNQKKFFEFEFCYTPMNERFREIDRFLWESRHQMTRYKNNYEGPAVINLTSWNQHYPNEYFDAFMYFLKSKAKQLDITFIIEQKCNVNILERLKCFFDVQIKSIDIDKTTHKGSTHRQIGFHMDEEDYQYV